MTKMTYIMVMIFAQFVLWNVTNAQFWEYYNASMHGTMEVSERSRRAPFHRYIPPNILTAIIIDGETEMHLTWKRVDRFLANKNLPVYTVHLNDWGPTHKKSNVMSTVGKFITYHDAEHKSAIMYFENLDRFEGVVGRIYQIVDLSIDQLSQPILVDGVHVRKLPHRPHGKKKLPAYKEIPRQNDVFKREINIESFNMTSLRSRRDAKPEPFYLETLLFVTYDIFQYIQSRYNVGFLNSIIISHLLHYNAIDMVFANLPEEEFEIYINLAGIIIEAEDGAFSRITNFSPLTYANNDILDINFLLEDFERYPNHFDFPFKKDSFDLIMISTKRELQYGRRKPNGWHSIVADIFHARKEGSQSTVPIAIVRSLGLYSSYCIVAYEIGKILGITQSDPFDKGITVNNMQCYGIMQNSQHHCSDCIKWSEESIAQLRTFFSQHPNRCFLLNKPRSLELPGIAVRSITPCRQCTCLGYYSYGQETVTECPLYIPADRCDLSLQCKRKDDQNQLQLEKTILPFDGTPCGKKKVCWDERCVVVGKEPPKQIQPKVFFIDDLQNELLN